MKLFKFIPAFLISTVIHATPSATATANVTYWNDSYAGQPVHLTSHHHYHIQSDVDGKVMFYFKMTLCVNDTKTCKIQNESLPLVKGQHFDRDVNLDMWQTFNAVGDHPIWATTEVTGGAKIYAQDQKYIWIK